VIFYDQIVARCNHRAYDMKPAAWTLRPARPADLDAALALLSACDLPGAGFEDQFGEAYVIAEIDGAVVGIAGVERHGRHGLLRSVAVIPKLRGAGLGAALVSDRLARARAHGLASLYLLTTTAERWFERHGFLTVDRAAAPGEIRVSSSYAGICPSTAVLMRYAGESPVACR
jgi:N-acetylglutamate synthase-like GNAT family acetyltransferase